MGESKRKPKKRRGSGGARDKFKFTVTLIVVCVVALGVYDFIRRARNSPLTSAVPARTKGNPSAALHIVEFADFQCPECARGTKLLAHYMKEYPNDIYFIYKYYPLSELNSTVSAVYGECAARQDRFWIMHDILFDRQSQWRALRKVEPMLEIIARDAGLDLGELSACVGGKGARSVVMTEKMLGDSYFVKSTPTYFINKEMVVGVESLKEFLEDHFNDWGAVSF